MPGSLELRPAPTVRLRPGTASRLGRPARASMRLTAHLATHNGGRGFMMEPINDYLVRNRGRRIRRCLQLSKVLFRRAIREARGPSLDERTCPTLLISFSLAMG